LIFAQPWMLLGALAALIPLLIHLFDRRRPRPHPFGAISFVLKSQKRTASRLKLKRLILYALRTLILLALPVALARPELRQSTDAAAAVRGPAATAIILDASLSMRWSDGTSLFERGRELARESLKDLLPEEPATVLLCTATPPPPPSLLFDRGRLRAAVDDAQVTYGAADLTRCLDLAARALEESPLPGKRLVLISDLAEHGLRLEAPAPTVAGPPGSKTERIRPEVVLRDAAGGREALPNRAIVDLKIEPALQVGPRAFQFTFTVRNFSPEPVKDLEASLRINGQVVAKGFVDLAPQGTAQKSLTHRFDAGGSVSGEVALTPDALPEDDRRAFAVSVPKELKALVINGSPHSVRYRDEAFFVDAALTSPGSPVRQALRDTEAGFREDFSGYDLVLLLNVPAPPPEVAAQLEQFVRSGGGLFISMGDNVDPDAYNQRLATVLPRPLRLTKTSIDPADPAAEEKAARLSEISVDHSVFMPFTGRAREGLMSSRFYRYMLLEPAGGAAQSEVLATLDDGAPAIAIARRGAGRVMLFTSTVDRDWSDFAIRTSFLPLMQRFGAYLCGALEEREELRARVGESIVLKPEAGQKARWVRNAEGTEVTFSTQPDGTLMVGPVEEPGVTSALDENGAPLPGLSFAAVLDPNESDLSRHTPDELEQHFGEDSVKQEGGGGRERRVPFWSWLIVAAAAAFFLEGVLLRR
jgi:hypothetical protein